MQVDAQVLEGIVQHQVVHENLFVSNRITALPVISHRLQIVGLIDLAEPVGNGFRIVEHKRGSTSPWENDQLQITAQAIAFEETTGAKVRSGAVFSWKSRRRREFAITPDLREQVEEVIRAMHATIATGMRPRPIEEKHKCKHCSVREVCQPTLVQKINRKEARS